VIDHKKMPTFIVIGASETGNASLYRYLAQHPDIFMSPIKEPMFFACTGRPNFTGPRDAEINRRVITSLEEYQALFDQGVHHRARGEASSAYLYYPKTAKRLRELAPDTKLIVTLRCPAERAYSNFLHALLLGREPIKNFEQALKAEPKRISAGWSHFYHYRSKGWYHRQLVRWLELFPREQVMINLYEDLRSDPAGLLREIFHFIGVEPDFQINCETRYNVSGPPWAIQLRLLLQRGSPAARRFLPDPIRASLKATVLSYTTGPSVMPRAIRRQVMDDYAPDVAQLSHLIGRDLSNWLNDQTGPNDIVRRSSQAHVNARTFGI
jgi:sulfotransferase family protein